MPQPQVRYRTSPQIPVLYCVVAALFVAIWVMSYALRTPEADYQREMAAAKKDLIGWTLRANKHAQLNAWSDAESTFSVLKDEHGEVYRVVSIPSEYCLVPQHDAPGVVFINRTPVSAVVGCEEGVARAFFSTTQATAVDNAFSNQADEDGATAIQIDGLTKQVLFPAAGLKRVVDLVN